MEEVRLTTPPPPAAQADPPRVAAAPPPPGLFVLFVDLRKVFDSMPRSIMWRILTRLGAPDGLVHCVRDMHEGMKSRVKYRGHLSAEFGVGAGVRQGDCRRLSGTCATTTSCSTEGKGLVQTVVWT